MSAQPARCVIEGGVIEGGVIEGGVIEGGVIDGGGSARLGTAAVARCRVAAAARSSSPRWLASPSISAECIAGIPLRAVRLSVPCAYQWGA